jgi:hypothetical protein
MFDLRTVLRLDAAASGGLGLLLLVLFAPARGELGVPVMFSLIAGVALLAWAALVSWVSVAVNRTWVKEVISFNAVYVVASVALVLEGWIALTELGVAFVLVQALAVLGLTVAQLAGLRRPVAMA